ncbi:hypothetical protein HBI81_085710 [Parastagonospora nodorum]|nr:hypothetical protein HBH53_067650 [Parastagonospora nodorum]KAH4605029.1 hypothetical protein HBH82_126270 [Parastagonospora nodorum]KAH4688303.1 hypothetical protein HBH78_102590 [Parastagonospora nodorum]KAH4706622.1 hypothetical protein HBH67_080570 [Parastagonospora nodorum]KAH4779276.1 hypothetical protein HBH62_144380 [Parastagonospora nodorum]
MPTPEGNVLKPIDPSAASSDDWEIFILNNAQVVHEKNGKPVSLLAAYADTPLKVTGTFTPGRGQSKYLLSKSKKPIDLEIRNVTRFSYGELTDGEFAIWAEGNAGWFEIRPAPHYNSIYEDMIEAVQLLYFVTDIYGEPRKKGGGPSTQLIFQEYAEDERFACTDPAVAAEIFHKHHIFLMMCFLNRAQGIGWSSTPIYQSFRRQFPKDFETCKARVEGRYTQVLPERPTRTSKSTTPSAPQAAPAAAQAKPGRGKAAVEKTDEAPKKDNNWWEAAALFEFMQKAVNQRALRAGRNQITVERLAQLVVKRYQIEDVETAQSVLLVHARNLCYMIGHPRRKSIRYFADEPIYQELMAGHSLSAAEQRRAEGVELKPRRDRATLKDEETQSSDTSSEEEDVITTPVRRPPGRRKKGRLSILRPTSSRLSGKSKSIKHKQDKAGKGKAPVPTSDESGAEEAEEDSDEATNSDDEMGVDTPTQALSPSREKRKLGETDADEQAEKTRRKRAASTPESPPTTVASEDEDADIPDGTAVPPLPLRHRPNSNNKSDVAPSLVSTPLPTYEPNGPRDSWICSFDGCSQRIYGCSKEIGRQLITEHLEDHAKGREKVVGILWREQDKLHLPVSNLIKKIREMSEASTPLFPVAQTERVQPRPIQRPV